MCFIIFPFPFSYSVVLVFWNLKMFTNVFGRIPTSSDVFVCFCDVNQTRACSWPRPQAHETPSTGTGPDTDYWTATIAELHCVKCNDGFEWVCQKCFSSLCDCVMLTSPHILLSRALNAIEPWVSLNAPTLYVSLLINGYHLGFDLLVASFYLHQLAD